MLLLFSQNLQTAGVYILAPGPRCARAQTEVERPYAATFTKDPEELLDYSVDWRRRLAVDDEIASSEWAITGDGDLLIDSSDYGETGTTLWLSDGTAGADYLVTNRITTTGGRVHECTFRVLVRSSGS